VEVSVFTIQIVVLTTHTYLISAFFMAKLWQLVNLRNENSKWFFGGQIPMVGSNG
jgi:hypothetical protein